MIVRFYKPPSPTLTVENKQASVRFAVDNEKDVGSFGGEQARQVVGPEFAKLRHISSRAVGKPDQYTTQTLAIIDDVEMRQRFADMPAFARPTE